MHVNSVKFRASAIGKLMTPPKTTADREAGKLSETTKTYLAELYRSLRYCRQKDFTSKEIEKGVRQEQDAITLLSLEKRIFLKKNDRRLFNDYVTGEPDIYIGKSIETAEEGFDTKCSWSLWTFPFEDDKLDKNYEWQNHTYMALTGARRWTTAYCLVNAPADLIISEKQKIWYAMGMPDDSNDRYMEKRREVDKNMIFDMAQFRRDNPAFDIDIEDWRYDIPRSERIKLFPVERSQDAIDAIYARIKVCRKYLADTYPDFFKQPSIEVVAK